MNTHDNEHEIDRWLESAMAQYGKAEPRGGLEERVMANLRSEQIRFARQRRWWWVASAVAATAAIVAGIWLGERDMRKTPTDVASLSTTSRDAVPAVPKRSAPPAETPEGKRTVMAGPPVPRGNRNPEPATAPKRDTFPSPSPLSEQEILLARYVREFHEKAVLVARAQNELRKQDERERESAPRNSDFTSDQRDN